MTEPPFDVDEDIGANDEITDELHRFTVDTATDMICRAAATAQEPGPSLCDLLECVIASVLAEEFKPDGQAWILEQIVEGVKFRLFGEDIESRPAAGRC